MRALTTGATDAVSLIANHEVVVGMAFGEQLKAHSTSNLRTLTGSPIRVGWRREDRWLIAGEKREEQR